MANVACPSDLDRVCHNDAHGTPALNDPIQAEACSLQQHFPLSWGALHAAEHRHHVEIQELPDNERLVEFVQEIQLHKSETTCKLKLLALGACRFLGMNSPAMDCNRLARCAHLYDEQLHSCLAYGSTNISQDLGRIFIAPVVEDTPQHEGIAVLSFWYGLWCGRHSIAQYSTYSPGSIFRRESPGDLYPHIPPQAVKPL